MNNTMTEGDTIRLKMKVIEYQRLTARARAGHNLDAEELKRLDALKATLSGWSVVDLMTTIPNLRFSSMPLL